MTLKYQIQFFDYWHLSSGLSAGAKHDSIVIRDTQNIPYIPAKTIKGLAREMLELDSLDIDFIHQCYFKNAILDEITSKEIVSNNLQDNLYDILASTQIGTDGIAVDDSLREIEVVVPLTLFGEILDISSKDDFEKLKDSLQLIKRMGLNRNRGLGRCQFTVIDEEVA